MIIVVDGNIGAGKSTLIEKLKEKNKNENIIFIKEPVDKFMEYKQFNPLKLMYDNPDKSAITQLHISNCLIDYFKDIVKYKDKIIICERGLLSVEVFSRVYRDNNHLSDFEYTFVNDHMQDKIKEIFSKMPIDAILFIDIPIDIALERISKRNREGENNISHKFLTDVQNSFNQTLKEYEYKIPIKRINYNDVYKIERCEQFLEYIIKKD